MRTLTLISGQWMPSRLRFPLLFLLPLILLAGSLAPGKRFLPLPPVTQAPLAQEYEGAAAVASSNANRVATDRIFPVLTDELEIKRQLGQGTLPSWNPLLGLGTPLAGASMASPWNPLRWPFLWLDPATASVWHALLSLVLGGLGMMMFLEGRGLKFTAAFFAAVTFQASGFMVANLHYIMKVDAVLWGPWCLWAVDLIFRGRKNAGLLLVGALGLSGLAGFPPVFLFVVAMTLAWIFVRALEGTRAEGELDSWQGSLKASMVFAFLGCSLAAVSLVPMAEAAQYSGRGTQSPLQVQSQSLPTSALVSSVLPMAFGLPTDVHSAREDVGTWFWSGTGDLEKISRANRLEWSLFAGLTALSLVLAALFARPRQSVFPLALLLTSWGFIFDWPGLGFLYGLPGMNLGSPARAAGLAAIAIAWLAALGFDALLSGQRAARVGTLLAGLCATAFGLWLWNLTGTEGWGQAVAQSLPTHVHPELGPIAEAIRQTASESAERLAASGLQLAGLGLGAVLLAYFAGRLTVRGGGVAGCLLLLLECSLAGLPHTTPTDLGKLPVFPPSQAMEAIRDAAGQGRVLRLDTSPSGIGDVVRLARPNMLAAYGIRDLLPYQALPSASLRDVWAALDPDGLFRTGVSRLSRAELLDRPVLDAMGVSCVLSTRPLEHPRLVQRYAAQDFFVYERKGALGLARIVPRIVESSPEGLQHLVSADHNLAIYALGNMDRTPLGGTQFIPGEWQAQRPSANRIDVAVKDSGGGFLVIHEGWMPDWKATVDGQDAEILRLDHLFFGVQIPAGNSTVRFKYEPWSMRLGALITFGALLCALLLTRGRHFRLRFRKDPTLDDASTNPG